MADSKGDGVAAAATRLEAAVDRLATAANGARRALDARPAEGSEPADGVPRAEVQALAERLDVALARLRALMGEED